MVRQISPKAMTWSDRGDDQDRRVAPAAVEHPAGRLAHDDAAEGAAQADEPGEPPRARERATRSVGSVMTRVDQLCWPKNARLKMAMTSATEPAAGTSITQGMHAALSPSAILRAALTDRPRDEQPARQPSAAQAADARRRIGDPADRRRLLQIEAMRLEQIFGQPEEVEIPGAVAEELRADDPTHFPAGCQPRDRADTAGIGHIAGAGGGPLRVTGQRDS